MDKAESIISEMFGKTVQQDNASVSLVLKNWNKILIDRRLPDHCHLEDINSTQLIVSFDHQGWIQVFKMYEKQILKNLNIYLKPHRISSVRMLMKADVEKYREKAVKPLSAVRKEENKDENIPFTDSMEEIKDDELKKQLENLKKILQGN